jgi:predicted unusual protein kinase regulating ubiquinone biosynthesis (AarF/ABC1/UbiB family)
VTLNIGDYVTIHDEYNAADESVLSLDYYVLRDNKVKAKAHFTQVKPMLACYEKYLGKYPEDIYDSFTPDAMNAASIGQVHKATKDGKKLAVKIQYPGVADSISSDLALVKPFAVRMFNIKGKDSDKYFQEVENKLLEETDYILELKQSIEVSNWCSKIEDLRFPKYYSGFSSEKKEEKDD